MKLHPVFYTGGSAAASVDSLHSKRPSPRLDNWMVILGVMLLVELFEPIQKALSIRSLTYLGDRSLSRSLTQHT